MPQRLTGKVTWFDPSKGYGYIDAGTGEDIFVYYEDIVSKGFKNLLAGDQVEFTMTRNSRGPVALEVTRV